MPDEYNNAKERREEAEEANGKIELKEFKSCF